MPFFSLPTGGASPVLAGNGAPTGALGNIGDLYLDKAGSDLYGPKTLDGWGTPIELFGSTGPSGPTGSTGAASTVTGPTAPASTLTVGSVTTGVAAVTITGTAPSQTINFVIPFVTGPTAPASTLTIGTVSTGAASAQITGTAPNQTLNLVLPVLTGPTGAASTVTGPTGSTGGLEHYATGTAPTASAGATWIDTDTGRLYVRYDGVWYEAAAGGVPSDSPSFTGTATFGGVILADDSTSTAAPVYSFTGNTECGIAHPAINQIGLVESGFERFRISGSGVNVYQVPDGTDVARIRLNTEAGAGQITLIGYGSNYAASTVFSLGAGSSSLTAVTGVLGVGCVAAQPLVLGTNNTERVRVTSAGSVGIGTTSPTAALDVNASTMRLRTARTPASSSATGDAGDICWDSSYLYVCIATNTWRRVAHSTW